MFKQISIIPILFYIVLCSCKNTDKHNETEASSSKPTDQVEVRIEVVPDIKSEEKNMSDADRMAKRINELLQNSAIKTEELKEQLNIPKNWKKMIKDESISIYNNPNVKGSEPIEIIIRQQPRDTEHTLRNQ